MRCPTRAVSVSVTAFLPHKDHNCVVFVLEAKGVKAKNVSVAICDVYVKVNLPPALFEASSRALTVLPTSAVVTLPPERRSPPSGAKRTPSSRTHDGHVSSLSGSRSAGALVLKLPPSFATLPGTVQRASHHSSGPLPVQAGFSAGPACFAVAAMRAFAVSLLELPLGGNLCDAGEAPDLHEVLAEVRGGSQAACRCPEPNQPVGHSFITCTGTAVIVRKCAVDSAHKGVSKKTRAGVAANLGKARAYNRAGGPAPPGIAALGAGVWHGDADETERGFVALGTPIGHPLYVAAHTDARSLEEARLLHELPMLPDLQCAWLLLAMCASPRADHLLHTLPPDLSAGYARGHDDAIWQCLLALRAKLTTPTLTSLRHAGSRCCLRVWEVWGCSAPNAPQHTGPPGSTPCPSCELVAPMPLSASSPSSVPVQLLLPPACEPLQRLDARSTVPDGKAALPGTTCTMACALHNAICLNLVRGARAGSTTALALALPTSARPSCCLPCHPLARPCCVRNLGRTQLSAVPSEACGGGCGCPCRSLPTDVAHRGTVAALSTPTVTTTPRALAPDCPAAVVGAHALCCDVTLVAPLTREGRPSPLLPLATAPPSLSRKGVSVQLTLSCCDQDHNAYASSHAKLAGAGVLSRFAWSARQGWLRRWWGFSSVALQSTVAATLLGAPYVAGALPGAQLPPLEDVLHDAVPPTQASLARRAQVARGPGPPVLRSSKRRVEKKI
eukprot:s484_g7.t1